MSIKVIVLCAGKGTRMKSEKAKVMHEIMGQPMSKYIYDIAKVHSLSLKTVLEIKKIDPKIQV